MNCDFSELTGKTINKISGGVNDDIMVFECLDGSVYKMYHNQDCCEDVHVEDIVGEISDVLNMPILLAEEVSNVDEDCHDCYDHFTWTFYKLATNRGAITIRWLGQSNGYYSEEVDFVQTKAPSVNPALRVVIDKPYSDFNEAPFPGAVLGDFVEKHFARHYKVDKEAWLSQGSNHTEDMESGMLFRDFNTVAWFIWLTQETLTNILLEYNVVIKPHTENKNFMCVTLYDKSKHLQVW